MDPDGKEAEDAVAEAKVPLRDGEEATAEAAKASGPVTVREKWSSKLDFILSCIGLCIGLGNVWRFPYLCYENGGGTFLIPYLITLFFGGIPMLMLELSLGQMLNVGGLGVWKYCPIFKGVGFCANIMAFWLNVYYIVIVAYALYYLGNSFTMGELPWKKCNESWNTHCCMSTFANNTGFNCTMVNISYSATNFTRGLLPTTLIPSGYNDSWGPISVIGTTSEMEQCQLCGKDSWNSPVAEFWERQALSMSTDIGEAGGLRWQLVLTLGIAWIVCYFCIFKGVQWTGKIVYVTALFPYMLLIILLFRGITLDGASIGIEYYLKPNFTKIQESKVWLQAASQIFFSLGLGLGTHIALGSYNPLTNNCYKDALLVGTINSCTSIFAGFVIFSVIGFMAKAQKKSVSQVAASGPGLAFLAYPSAISELPAAPIWAVLFFLMVFFFCTVEGFITAVADEWPLLRVHRKKFVLVLCMVSFVIGLSMVSTGGAYVFNMFDSYAASGPALLLLIGFECIAFAWFFGIFRLREKMKMVIGHAPPIIWQICVTVLCPLSCFGVLAFSVLEFKPLIYTRSTAPPYKYPDWAQALGAMLALSSVVAIPIYAIYYAIRTLCFTDNKHNLPLSKRIKDMFRKDIPEIDGAPNPQLQMNPMAASL
uniref:Transporter n=1 Tax=Macrostomum lignano TaxID=282301 RepID=A0A1I8GGY3_9PLAT